MIIKLQGIDCSTPLNAANIAALKSLGYSFVCRYLGPDSSAKHLSADEAKLLSQAGFYILSIFETFANRALGGAGSGQTDGASAYQFAKALQMPPGACIFFAVDFDAALKDMNTIVSYLQAAAKETRDYPVGVYGSYQVVETMKAKGAASLLWQTYAWSSGKLPRSAAVYQYKNNQTVAGINVDLNEADSISGMWKYQNGTSDNAMAGETGNTPSPWAANAVEKAKKKGILIGDESGNLKLQEPVTKEELLLFLDRLGLLN